MFPYKGKKTSPLTSRTQKRSLNLNPLKTLCLIRASTPVGDRTAPTPSRIKKRSLGDDERSTSSRDEEVCLGGIYFKEFFWNRFWWWGGLAGSEVVLHFQIHFYLKTIIFLVLKIVFFPIHWKMKNWKFIGIFSLFWRSLPSSIQCRVNVFSTNIFFKERTPRKHRSTLQGFR